jgi:hypothetical protein
VGLQLGAAASGSTLTTTNLKAALTQPVTLDAGASGSASWSGTDWDAPFATLASGPVMSSWQYRKQVGADAHLVAWLEVRLWSTGAVEVLPWVENGYLTVAGPTSKAATFNFTIGGTARLGAGLAITLLNHQRTPLLNGTAVAHWLGTDPDLVVRHDVAYLQATRLVPYYSGNVSPAVTAVGYQPTSFTPLQQGSYPNGMGAGGYSPSIGILPEWDVLYLTCTAPALWKVVQWQGYSAGRYGIHFRDQATNRPPRFSQHPNLVLDLDRTSGVTNSGTSATSTYTPTATGTVPPAYTNTHAPAMGYFAYLLTGRVFHLETAQFEACVNYLKQGSAARQGSQGIFLTEAATNTTRGAAHAGAGRGHHARRGRAANRVPQLDGGQRQLLPRPVRRAAQQPAGHRAALLGLHLRSGAARQHVLRSDVDAGLLHCGHRLHEVPQARPGLDGAHEAGRVLRVEGAERGEPLRRPGCEGVAVPRRGALRHGHRADRQPGLRHRHGPLVCRLGAGVRRHLHRRRPERFARHARRGRAARVLLP